MDVMKGVDNPTYYRLVDNDPRFYMDYTGTGNSLSLLQQRTLQLVMDSLRYWVTEMHVDGFRFDLAATLARGLYDGDRLSAFFDTGGLISLYAFFQRPETFGFVGAMSPMLWFGGRAIFDTVGDALFVAGACTLMLG